MLGTGGDAFAASRTTLQEVWILFGTRRQDRIEAVGGRSAIGHLGMDLFLEPLALEYGCLLAHLVVTMRHDLDAILAAQVVGEGRVIIMQVFHRF